MKTIGLLGGMSWESTVPYYRLINQGVSHRLGGLHCAKILLHSVDFHEIEACQRRDEWDKAGEILARAALGLEKAGAEGLVLCTNTMHKVADYITARCSLPFLHIAQPTGVAVSVAGISQVALLGTRYTMEQDFYRGYLKERFAITSLIPDETQRQQINQIIYNQLCLGKITAESKHYFLRVIEILQQQGAQGVILGCTEIGMLVQQKDCQLPIFDTTVLHANAVVDFMLENE